MSISHREPPGVFFPILLSCAALSLFAVQGAQAEEAYRGSGMYLGVSGGLQERTRSAESAIIWTDWDSGSAFSGLAGYRFDKRWRVDAEFTRFKNDADVLSGGVGLVAPASGNAVLHGVFVNANVDFEIQPRWTLSFALGAGRMKSYVHDLTNSIISGVPLVFDGNSKKWVNAWQFKTDLSYGLTDNLQLFAMYRHVDAAELNFLFNTAIGPFPAGPKDTVYNSGELGLRYSF